MVKRIASNFVCYNLVFLALTGHWRLIFTDVSKEQTADIFLRNIGSYNLLHNKTLCLTSISARQLRRELFISHKAMN
jgi:hypothetical protein